MAIIKVIPNLPKAGVIVEMHPGWFRMVPDEFKSRAAYLQFRTAFAPGTKHKEIGTDSTDDGFIWVDVNPRGDDSGDYAIIHKSWAKPVEQVLAASRDDTQITIRGQLLPTPSTIPESDIDIQIKAKEMELKDLRDLKSIDDEMARLKRGLMSLDQRRKDILHRQKRGDKIDAIGKAKKATKKKRG
jgi:hypothetical protein